MTFTSKAEADAYDKMLDTADELSRFLAGSSLISDEQQTEALALYLAQHKDELLVALGAKKPQQKADKTVAAEKATKVAFFIEFKLRVDRLSFRFTFLPLTIVKPQRPT